MDSLLSSASNPITEGLCCSASGDDVTATTTSATINTKSADDVDHTDDKKYNNDRQNANEIHSTNMGTATNKNDTISNTKYNGMDKYERFESWLRENGGQFEMVSL